jgi:hypothetical protein
MKNNTIAKIGLYFGLMTLVVLTIYQLYSENQISSDELNLVYPFFFLILSLFQMIKHNEIKDTVLNRKSGFDNFIHNWKLHSYKPTLMILLTVLAIMYSVLLNMSGESALNIIIVIASSIVLYSSIIFFLNNKAVTILFWINFYIWQISFILFAVTETQSFFLDNLNPLGSLIPYIFQ